jgi:hypothetical protein
MRIRYEGEDTKPKTEAQQKAEYLKIRKYYQDLIRDWEELCKSSEKRRGGPRAKACA